MHLLFSRASTSSGWAAGWMQPSTIWPGCIMAHSAGVNSLTLATMSQWAYSSSADSTIRAPAAA